MSTNDTCCSIVPYFKVNEGKCEEFKALCEEFVARTSSEEACLYYGFAMNQGIVHCREGYTNAKGVLAHIENVGDLIGKALEISELVQFEIHGPAQELAQLKEPLKDLDIKYFELEYGFRK
ncbi:hypothetical protein PQO03_14405 [Lentisphaera profundi]|uniref:ABM domain-containing protein n=1 Tax=Lentisphaera profundi TaxID=1658616 RepID=A0ABY7W1Y7_9BACT|nr:hypothetical protein [Lentisphaera profundi]WDE99026.1 hypothetical protein PQO03_14405 [Lentisphaera profundi]